MSRWETKALGEVAYLAGRIGWKGLTAKEYTAEGPLFLSVHSLNYGDHVDFRDAFHISQERYDESPEIMLQDGDVLICKDGAGIGKVGIVDRIPGPSTINSSLLLIRALKQIEPKYLYFALCSPSFQKIVQERIDGATTPHLYQREIRTFSIPVPPLAEQRRIVAILDEAFAGLAKMRANAEANLKNARALFDSHLNKVFSDGGEGWENKRLQDVSIEFGRGRSRHRPRNASFLYGGPYPFIQTGDVRNSDHLIREFSQTYSEAGLAQSKLWPAGTICITIAANIAETGILTFDACFPDSVIGIVVDPTKTTNNYVEFLLQSVRARLKAEGKGSAQDNINLATFENARFPFPSLTRQNEIVETLSAVAESVQTLTVIGQQKLAAIDALQQSILAKAFAGELTKGAVPAPLNDNNLRSALVIALAYARHRAAGLDRTFGHTKEQKIMHLVESEASFYLGRNPQKDAAGPNDFRHMLAAEAWAEEKRHFRVRDTGKGYRLETLEHFDALLRQADAIDPDTQKAINRVIDVFLPMNMREAELFATVYAAWNNLKLDGKPDTDDAIIREAREDWHPKKLEIPRSDFVKALAAVRKSGMVPRGNGRRVGERQLRLA